MEARQMECQKTHRKIGPSFPSWFVAAVATQIDCASTIFPITPPALFAAHINTGFRLSCSEVMRCKLPNSAFDEVSLPVSATPSHPRNVPKKGNSHPVRVNARPRTASMPEYRVRYPRPSMQPMATIANRSLCSVWPKTLNISPMETRKKSPERTAARKQADPVAVSQLKSYLAFSGEGFGTTGLSREMARCRIGKSQPF